MTITIPYGRQDVTEADIAAVEKVLRSDWLTQGPIVPAFESAVRHYCKTRDAIAANSATSALHIACLALGLGPGDRLWTTPITFVASANCGLYCGATVDFVDIDPKTYNMSADALAEKLRVAGKLGQIPKVVVPVHFAGQSCDMERISDLSKEYGFSVVEDASHAIGGRYQDSPIGSCRFSDVTVFSFHPVKIITTGEGGIALTNDRQLAERMERLRSHGITRNSADFVHAAEGPWYYEQLDLGYNYRMTDIQAALGLSQFDRLDAYVERRHVLASRYDELLADLPIVVPWRDPACYSALHLYPIWLDVAATGVSRAAVFEFLRGRGIGANVHYIPVYRQPYFRRLGFSEEYCSEAERYYAGALTLPLYPTMSDEQQDQVVDVLGKALRQ